MVTAWRAAPEHGSHVGPERAVPELSALAELHADPQDTSWPDTVMHPWEPVSQAAFAHEQDGCEPHEAGMSTQYGAGGVHGGGVHPGPLPVLPVTVAHIGLYVPVTQVPASLTGAHEGAVPPPQPKRRHSWLEAQVWAPHDVVGPSLGIGLSEGASVGGGDAASP